MDMERAVTVDCSKSIRYHLSLCAEMLCKTRT